MDDSRPPGRILFDFSDWSVFIGTGRVVSGIQRTAQNIARAATALDAATACIAADPADGCLRFVNPAVIALDLSRPLDAVLVDRARPPPFADWKYQGRPVKRAFHRLRHRWRAAPDARAREAARPGPPCIPFLTDAVRLRPDDTVVALGAGWDAGPLYHALREARRTLPLRIVPLLYDLIPVLGFERDFDRRHFDRWISTVIPMADRIVAISESTRHDFLRLSGQWGGFDPRRVAVCTLAHEFPGHADGPGASPGAGDGWPYVLFVGGCGGRKNGRLLVELWREIASGPDASSVPRLVVTGSPPEGPAPHDDRDGPVLFLGQPDDRRLAALYRGCRFSVFPSRYEGWGLPVGESLWFGKFCITSQGSSLAEAGGAWCDYVAPDDREGLKAAILRCLREPGYVDRRAAAIDRGALRTWGDVGRDLLRVVRQPP